MRSSSGLSLASLVFTGLCAGTLAASFPGCSSPSEAPPNAPISLDNGRQLSVALDPSLSASDQTLVQGDFNLLSNLQFNSASSTFKQIFGGTTSNDVLTYIDERVKFVVPNTQNIDQRILLNASSTPPESGGVILASNIGTPLWLYSETIKPQKVQFRVGNQAVPVSSSRVGIVMLGEGYRQNVGTMLRLSTLVHEARHSDCTGGISRADVQRIHDGQLPTQKTCGHLHVDCPVGHPLAGLPACDDHSWGAYAIELVFTAITSRECTNCSETQKQQALAIASDSASRITVLTPMLDGNLGAPDMTSGGVRN
ncbi:MAG: hypothetical protein H7222_11940 [Methylotenera sp.]|nr:hypothetical protein [Oligoflexia bacterium]